MDLTQYMDPFHGNGATDLPEPEGIAATWFFLKAQTGNTHPGACAPFGMVSACAYSGAYVTGYGLHGPNTHGRPPLRFSEYCASGFTHLHQSGTGMIGIYYNYARVTPLQGPLAQLGTRWPLWDEVARPGYYAATLGGTGIRAELTVGRGAALHRYTFPSADGARLAIDFSAGGLDFPKMRTFPAEGEVEVLSPYAARAYVLMEGIPLYIYAEVDPEGPATDAASCQLWVGHAERPGESRLRFERIEEASYQPFGAVWEPHAGQQITLRLGFSCRSYQQAADHAAALRGQSLDAVAEGLRQTWNDYASRIQVKGGSETQRQIFYSCLYHSLIKPADFSGESPFWPGDAPFYVDFATLWDQYKTQLPLVCTVYPERGAAMVNSLLNMAEYRGDFCNCTLLSTDWAIAEGQARALSHHVIADAFHRRLPGIDWRRALRLMVADIRKERNRDFLEEGIAHPYTHTLDLADACWATGRMAKALGEEALAQEMAQLAERWRNVYDPRTGRLGESRYYEGGPWNYSFRLLHDMAGRIALYPQEADFVADLDRFFGYGQPPVRQPVDPADREYMAYGFSLNRFEGYNNEPDIETPYAYIYAGRHDRTAEVVRAGMKYLYATGRGGLPGNDDSGALSSCYVWNALGLFPVAAQPLLLIGSPLFPSATIQVGERAFTVEAADTSEENLYVQGATLNGEPLDRAYLTVGELLAGGRLALRMGPRPSTWAKGTRPPSRI